MFKRPGSSLRPTQATDWHRPDVLSMPIVALGKHDYLTAGDFMTGAVALGDPGSGKSSFQILCSAGLLRAGMSVVFFTVKPRDAKRYEDLARWCKRDDITIYRPLAMPFNPLEDLRRRSAGRLGATEQMTAMVMDTVRRLHQGGSSDGRFWESLSADAAHALITLAQLADTPISFAWLAESMRTLPRSSAEAADPAWQASNPACQAIVLAKQRSLTPADRADLDRAARYVLAEAPRTPSRQMASINSTLTAGLSQLIRGEIGHAVNQTIGLWSPEHVVTRLGVLILDCSVHEFGEMGRVMQRLIKSTLVDVIATRNLAQAAHPVVLVQDEIHELIDPRTDPKLMRTLRENRGAVLGATQVVSNMVTACEEARDPHAAATALLGLPGIKAFCSSTDPETLRFAEAVLGATPHTKISVGRSDRSGSGESTRAASDRSSNFTTQTESDVPAYQISQLKRGGPANRNVVETFVTCGGRVFRSSGKSSLKLAFKQINLERRSNGQRK